MAGTTSLPDDLVEHLSELYGTLHPKTGKRWTLRELAAVASQRFPEGVQVSHMAVQRALRPVLAERAQIAREVLRAKITERINLQIDTLDDLLVKIAADAFAEDVSAYQRSISVDTYRKALESKLRFGGVGERMEVEADVHVDATVHVTDARAELAEALAREAAGPARRSAPGGPGSAPAGSG